MARHVRMMTELLSSSLQRTTSAEAEHLISSALFHFHLLQPRNKSPDAFAPYDGRLFMAEESDDLQLQSISQQEGRSEATWNEIVSQRTIAIRHHNVI